ncbi:RluA family pseudouridine synthase [Accumulibacter sp.]|uniref:RluA family pseudouridine synthase n=1 Tax=Accumulibacter sp. TaxID=2053492 RepID=UPI0025E4EC44|nr:RluA family pseudouridine synthase [Accumulibacter sp.]MCM8611451.1 RluA family pseudouridine synthase [Accumulibacter sp.]MCM8635085.1 RluA family pseudouridine synthase [Accumulibacter sp.]MCM8641008.1 RluA family pseudouridine synthase [Accumulibacter sp.]
MPSPQPSALAALPYAPPPDRGPEIAYLDASLLLVNKPAGLLAVPGRGAGMDDCLLRRVQALVDDALLVHRLDLHTSGLLVLARGREMQRRLAGDFAARRVHKRYQAVVAGPPPAISGTIDLPLAADWRQRPRQKVDRLTGKPSLTRYQLLSHDPASNRSRLALFPETGRTHQLRVHLQALGHAIIGDRLYGDANGGSAAERLLLHADQLRFVHPASGRQLCIDSPAPF